MHRGPAVFNGEAKSVRNGSALREWLGITLALLAASAPVVTGLYFLALAGGDPNVAREMFIRSDTVSTALGLLVPFYLLIAAGVALALTRPRLGPRWGVGVSWIALLVVVSAYVSTTTAYIHTIGRENIWAIWTGLAVIGVAGWGSLFLRFVFPPTSKRAASILHNVAVALHWISALLIGLLMVTVAFWTFFAPTIYNLRFSAERGASGFDQANAVWFQEEAGGTWYVGVESRSLLWHSGTPNEISVCHVHNIEDCILSLGPTGRWREETTTPEPSPSTGSPSSTPEPSGD